MYNLLNLKLAAATAPARLLRKQEEHVRMHAQTVVLLFL
jgi:hypothetical protein